jgi:hypothetical protein
MKKQWDAKVSAADKFVAANDTPSLSASFAILRLSPTQHGIFTLPAQKRPAKVQSNQIVNDLIRQAFFDKAEATRGFPFFSVADRTHLSEQIKYTKDDSKLQTILAREMQSWMRAAARLRKDNVNVEFAAHRHLEWMKPWMLEYVNDMSFAWKDGELRG